MKAVIGGAVLVVGLIAGGIVAGGLVPQEEPERPSWLSPVEEAKNTEAPKVSKAVTSTRSRFPPDEPGVLDVQRWDWLQQDLERLVDQTHPTTTRRRLSPKEFQKEFIKVTADFLELEKDKRARFVRVAGSIQARMSAARSDVAIKDAKPTATPISDTVDTKEMAARQKKWKAYVDTQKRAVQEIAEALEAKPRHTLLKDEALKWLLRLDYGVRRAGQKPGA